MFVIMGFHNPAVSQCPVDGGSLVLPATVLQRKIVTAALAVGADIRPYSNPEIGTGYDIGSKVIPFHLAQSLMSLFLDGLTLLLGNFFSRGKSTLGRHLRNDINGTLLAVFIRKYLSVPVYPVHQSVNVRKLLIVVRPAVMEPDGL